MPILLRWWNAFLKEPLLWLLLLLIAASEVAGSAFLVREDWLQTFWWYALTGHILLSGLAGGAGAAILRKNYPMHGSSVFIFFSLFALCIPILGSVGVLCLVCFFRYWETETIPMSIGVVNDPEYGRGGRADVFQYHSGDIHSLVSNASISDMQRMQALFKLKSLQSRKTTQAFRSLLMDESEDLRLVAFGLLDKTEKAIFSRVYQELSFLEQAVNDEQKVEHWRQLAYTYWELVYQQAVVGDVLTFAMDQVRMYAKDVLSQDDRDGGMWSLLGQVSLHVKDYDEARECFSQALGCGLSESRIIPYMAEVLFQQREFQDLQVLLSIQSSLMDVAALQPVLEYWGKVQPVMEAQGVHV